jgi:serine/threonine protein kinase
MSSTNESWTLEDSYMIIEQLGKGSFGNVFLALDKTTKERVAIK